MISMPLDLSSYFNHIIVDNSPSDKQGPNNYGVAGIRLLKLPHSLSFENVDFVFAKNSENSCDNMICDGQRLLVGGISASSISFIGFCEYGTVSDEVILYDGDISRKEEIIFKTFHSNCFQGLDNILKYEKCQPSARLTGTDGQKHNLYCWTISLKPLSRLDYIEFPINLSLHIVAITLNINPNKSNDSNEHNEREKYDLEKVDQLTHCSRKRSACI